MLKSKNKLLILLFLGLLLVGLVQLSIFGFERDAFESILLNLFVQLVFVIFLVYFVDEIIKDHDKELKDREERMKNALKEKYEWERFNKYTKIKYRLFVNNLAKHYVHIVTKKPPVFTNKDLVYSRKEFEEIIKKIDTFIGEDFFNKNVKVDIINQENIFRPDVHYVSHFKMLSYIKKNMKSDITEFLDKYVIILPETIVNSIYEIENLLESNFFQSPNDHFEHADNFKVGNFDKKMIEEKYRELGSKIVDLLKYVDNKD
ncbi:hypothetical protein [Alkalihalobacillus sp. 1P02AB]|uniref:hypothetical protein n=1 Tax=Alkalihalobacillus sp. 1P02AB TaxID=3132260 RepID=UPI0039A52FEB